MEVTSGYKQTDFGVLPQDWAVNDLGSHLSFITSGSRGWAGYYSDHGVAFLRITNLSRESSRQNSSMAMRRHSRVCISILGPKASSSFSPR